MPGQLLPAEHRLQIEAIASGEGLEMLRRRARILILYDDGCPTREVAERLSVSRGCARRWRSRYRQFGMEVFAPRRLSLRQPVGEPSPASDAPQEQDEGTSVGQVGEAQAEDESAGKLRELALALWDITQGLHGQGESSRRVLAEAASLYAHLAGQGHKLSRRAVEELAPANTHLAAEEMSMLGGVVWLQGGQAGARRLERLGFEPEAERQTLALAGLLRMARALYELDPKATVSSLDETSHGLQLVVDGPLTAPAALQHSTRLWLQAGYPPMRLVTLASLAEIPPGYPPFPEPLAAPGILPDDLMAEAGRKTLLFQFAEMLRHEEGTRLGEDIEALHDMRVATRRMRAAFEVFSDAFEPDAIKRHLKGLRATGRALGHVRDLDVFMEKAQHYLDTLPEAERSGLDPLLHAWQVERESARAEMLEHLTSPRYRLFKLRFNLFLHTPGAGARQPAAGSITPNHVREAAPVLIYSRLAAVRAFEPLLASASIEQLHALRIEFKKLRYSVEYFREVLGEEAKAVITDLKKMQDHLGDLNDAQVATGILSSFLSEWDQRQALLPLGERQNPEPIVAYLAARHAERHRLMVTFGEAWANFNRPEFLRNLAMAVSVL